MNPLSVLRVVAPFYNLYPPRAFSTLLSRFPSSLKSALLSLCQIFVQILNPLRAAKISDASVACINLWSFDRHQICFFAFFVWSHSNHTLWLTAADGDDHIFRQVGRIFRKFGYHYVRRACWDYVHYSGRGYWDSVLSGDRVILYQNDHILSRNEEHRCLRRWR